MFWKFVIWNLKLFGNWWLEIGTSSATHGRVWAFPLSLSATDGISIDFSSSPYLDVSVWTVPSTATIQLTCVNYFDHGVIEYELGRISPFGHRRITGSWLLHDEYRYHVRPSSATYTKAFTVCVNIRLIASRTARGNPKSKILNPKQFSNFKIQNSKLIKKFWTFEFSALDLFRN